MKYFTLEMEFATLNNKNTIFCYTAKTKLGNDVISNRGNTEDEAVLGLFEAVSFELS